ncbi:serine protease AprX [Dysgonomonas sp. PH5-45]|uniref:S8 family serine peptidase n=1 Tax=unclassified Dysgonomonas TaxID=2630389 RepID=UPI0024769E96|nr:MULTISPECIES: S8 family serine peptidase [unclassified Dysgonomonas]MDH6354162.1 serine protease AprX [Dysgonomonas sp. PH5-45]MDH6386987.1 serine protease AprX [Dysgonomonas sp. PH5-37]
MKKRLLLIPVFLLTVCTVSSQTLEERTKIISKSNPTQIERLEQRLEKNEKERQSRISAYLEKNKISLRTVSKDGTVSELVDVIDGQPIYYATYNAGSARTMRANTLFSGGKLGLELDGTDMVAGVFEGGRILDTHQEFSSGGDGNSLIKVMDNNIKNLPFNEHTTHVAGTISALGVNSGAKGIASGAEIHQYSWTNDLQNMSKFGRDGYLASNHSYGLDMSRGIPEWYLGAYDATAAYTDAIAYTYPKYQIVFAAGNDRNTYTTYYPTHNKSGYDLLTQYGVSKNTLTVAAIHEMNSYSSPADVQMSNFSNFGPTDDGRIKPNISAKGVSVFSPISTANDAYGSKQGTSMSAPAIAGAVLLLQKHYKNVNGDYMNSATVRGLLQHTAFAAGSSMAPDYRFGWGAANLEDAALVISNNDNTALVKELTLNNNETYELEFEADGSNSEYVRVSISWTDPAGTAIKDEIDSRTKVLVNDLDLRVIDAYGTTNQPWRLNPENPSAVAEKGDNNVDNFERVDISAPFGKHKLIVSHKGTLVDDKGSANPQDYTLIVTGPNLKLSSASIESEKTSNASVYPIPAKNTVYVSVNKDAKYTLFEILGRQIASGSFAEGENSLDVSSLASGSYLLRIDTGDSVETKKIILE